jgi:hypothetical protein
MEIIVNEKIVKEKEEKWFMGKKVETKLVIQSKNDKKKSSIMQIDRLISHEQKKMTNNSDKYHYQHILITK